MKHAQIQKYLGVEPGVYIEHLRAYIESCNSSGAIEKNQNDDSILNSRDMTTQKQAHFNKTTPLTTKSSFGTGFPQSFRHVIFAQHHLISLLSDRKG